MRLVRNKLMGSFVLTDLDLINQIILFPEHGMGYSLADVTLKDGTLIEQVVICNGDVVCFHDNMRRFSENEIANVAVSQMI
jgi:hypothetical protein